jgi:hypothetical protein
MNKLGFGGLGLSVVLALVAGCGDDGGSTGTGGGGTGGEAATTGATTTTGGEGGAGTTTGNGGAGGGGEVAPDLTGQFASGCLAVPQQDGSTQYISLTFDNTATDWAIDYVVHGDDMCASDFIAVRIEGPYALTAPSSVVDGAWDGDFEFTKRTITPGNDMATGFLSSLQGCGDGNFVTGMPTDIHTTGCLPLGQYPVADCSQDYDIAKLENGGDVLRFGTRPADNNMCTADKRPTELSPVMFMKQ